MNDPVYDRVTELTEAAGGDPKNEMHRFKAAMAHMLQFDKQGNRVREIAKPVFEKRDD